MTTSRRLQDELRNLLWSLEDGSISAGGLERIDELVRSDEQLLHHYIEHMRLVSDLRFGPANGRVSDVMARFFDVVQGPGGDDGSAVRPPNQPDDTAEQQFLIPPIVVDSSPVFGPSLFTLHSSVGGFLFSYLVAAMIVAAALLAGWTWRISQDREIAKGGPREAPGAVSREIPSVGRITGTVDCRWTAPENPAFVSSHVPLGRKYDLVSGLVEITYDTGAKIILEGPCTYEVDSARGGFLSLGKLTARVESPEARGERTANPTLSEKETQPTVSLAPRPSSGATADSRLSTLDSGLFRVRTPTAVVIDLGTEFGVEVSKKGTTTSHVFRGSVRVQVAGGNGKQSEAVLREDESASVAKREGTDGPRLVLDRSAVSPVKFVRRLAERPKALDLLDIVAGGNGTTYRRECGIDPATGMQDPSFVARTLYGDGRYHRAAWHKLIDGVFIPDGSAGPVQLDSAGHKFDGLPRTRRMTYGSIWSRAAEIRQPSLVREVSYWVYSMGRGEEFMPEGRGLLALHANVGITFDLEAMRKVHRERSRGVFAQWPAWLTRPLSSPVLQALQESGFLSTAG